jgi:hypothetical protein
MKNIIICLAQGRLGNIVYQYQAASFFAQNGKVIALKSEYFEIFDCPAGFCVIPIPGRLYWKANNLWNRCFELLAKYKIFGKIQPIEAPVFEEYIGETEQIQQQSGFFKNIFIVRGFFQTAKYQYPLPKLKPEVLLHAEKQLGNVEKLNRIAVHLRFGDYTSWRVFGEVGAAQLPENYYLDAVRLVTKCYPRAHFIVVSDDHKRATEIINKACSQDQITVTDGRSPIADFALIASCSHAIISASSFSLWAALLIQNTDKLVVAPEYWTGFRRRTWFPLGVRNEAFHYINPIFRNQEKS